MMKQDYHQTLRDSHLFDPATKEQADAGTFVIWDINICPVLDECDASRVGLRIRRALKNLGYNDPVTITAIGTLTDLPLKLLQSVSSAGIVLCHTISTNGVSHALQLLLPTLPNQSNILLLSPGKFSRELESLQKKEYNVLAQVFTAVTSAEVESLWEIFLKDTLDSEEEKYSETSECEWICRECEVDEEFYITAGQGFENFINHLLSDDHHEWLLDYLHPTEHKSYNDKFKVFRDYCLENAATSVNNELKRKRNRGPEDDPEDDKE